MGITKKSVTSVENKFYWLGKKFIWIYLGYTTDLSLSAIQVGKCPRHALQLSAYLVY